MQRDKYHPSQGKGGKEKQPIENVYACHAKMYSYFKMTGSVSVFQQTWAISGHSLRILC